MPPVGKTHALQKESAKFNYAKVEVIIRGMRKCQEFTYQSRPYTFAFKLTQFQLTSTDAILKATTNAD